MDSDAPAPKLGTSPVLAATVAAAATIAQHVIGRATRDALFLSRFPPSRLPLVMMAGAVVSALVVLAMTRLLQRRGPERVVPAALVAHAAVALLEWALASRFESAVAVAVYMHTASFGATIVSSFWSLVGESFDPHQAKRVVGRIGAGAALGGVIGGALAWGSSSRMGVSSMLVAVAALSVVAAWGTRALSRGTRMDRPPPSLDPARGRAPGGLGALRQTPYLLTLALLVAAGGVVQSLVDYTMGVAVTATYGSGPRLLSFFAAFQTVIGVVSFLLQLAVNRLALERLGVGRTLALLPLGVGILGGVVVLAPSLLTVALQRGAEGVLRGSLFRSAYEVLFTPVPQSRKRPTKTVIDVGFDRIGMVAGGGLTLAILHAWPGAASRVVTFASVLASLVMLAVAYRVHGGYVATLAERLQRGTLKLDARSIVDATTRRTFARTMDGLDRKELLAQIDALRASARAPALEGEEEARSPDPEEPELDLAAGDERVDLLADLRARDVATVRRALGSEPAHLRALSHALLDLLARDDVARHVARALGPLVPGMVGAIVDAVLDPARPLRARRRAARLLSAVSSPRAADALVHALDAEEIDVRYASGRVLVGMREQNPELRFDHDAALARALRELEATAGPARDPRCVEHAFNVLALTFPREPTLLAYGALAGHDRFLRGVALEYLDVVLPARVRAALALRLEAQLPLPAGGVRAPAAVSSAASLTHLLESKAAIQSSLAELRRARDPDAD